MDSSVLNSELSTSDHPTSVPIDKYVSQLEKRVTEQEQLIALLNGKIAELTSSASNSRPETGSSHFSVGDQTARHSSSVKDRGVSFVGSRKTDAIGTVPFTKYTPYFVTRVGPAVSAKDLAGDLLSNVPGLSSLRCCKIKTRHNSYASFHLVIQADECHLVESEGTWPEGSLVKTFSGRLLPGYIIETFDTKNPAPKLDTKKKPDTKKPPKLPVQSSDASGVASKSSGDKGKPVGSVSSSPLNTSGSGALNNQKPPSFRAANTSSASPKNSSRTLPPRKAKNI